MNIARWISLAIAAAFCAWAWLSLHSGEMLFRTAAYLIFPLGFIWYGNEVGRFSSGWRTNLPTPGIMVKIAGWVLLLITPVAVNGLKAYLQAGLAGP